MMAHVSFPARCSVAVICRESLISQVYPAAVPIEVFIDSAIELLNEDLKRRGEDGLSPEVTYELQRANGTRLDVRKTLDELGIEDGAALVLVPAEEGESFEPQYESLSTGLAKVSRTLFPPVTKETAVRTALAILSAIAVTIIGLSVYVRANGQSLMPMLVTLTAGMVLALTWISVRRWWPEHADLIRGLGWPAVPLLSSGIAMAAPGGLGAPHLFIGAIALAGLAYGMEALAGGNIMLVATAVTLCVTATFLAGIRMWGTVSDQRLGICALVGLLILLAIAPTVALWAARIRPPHFGSVTGRDLFRRSDGMPVDAVAPVEEATEDQVSRDGTPQGHAIATAAIKANGVLTGICFGAAIVLPAAVGTIVVPGASYAVAAVALGVLLAWIFVSRARAFTDCRQAIALVSGAVAALCAMVGRYVLQDPGGSSTALLWGAAVLVCVAAAGLAAALVVPVTRFTPIVRMIVEWLELAAIVTALPLAAWIGGVFNWVRMR